MPLLGAVQTPTALAAGQKVAVLNAENLANGGFTMAVAFTPQPQPVTLAIYNASGQTVTLQASPDLTSGDFLPVSVAGSAVSVANNTVAEFAVAPSLFYAVKAGAAITAGTIWLAR